MNRVHTNVDFSLLLISALIPPLPHLQPRYHGRRCREDLVLRQWGFCSAKCLRFLPNDIVFSTTPSVKLTGGLASVGSLFFLLQLKVLWGTSMLYRLNFLVWAVFLDCEYNSRFKYFIKNENHYFIPNFTNNHANWKLLCLIKR